MPPSSRCVFCDANLPHERHVTPLQAAKEDIRILTIPPPKPRLVLTAEGQILPHINKS